MTTTQILGPRVTVTPPSPAELDSFWAQTLARAATQPLQAKIEEATYKEHYRRYRVTYLGLDGVPIRAYLGIPIDPGTREKTRRWPAVVQGPGYSGHAWDFDLGEASHGYAILNVFPRGQGESAELWQVKEGAYQAWVHHGREHQEGFYYQGAYTDLLRGIDYLLTRPEVDPGRIGVMGSSQGGLLALGLAAIDPRVKACVSALPFGCDFMHNSSQEDSREARDADFLRVWQYFEPVNLARRITAPTLLSSGGRDFTCPPPTIRAVYDYLPGIKGLIHYPDLGHSGSVDFSAMAWDWLRRYLA